MIELILNNYLIEDIVVKGNYFVDNTNKDKIYEECRKNNLIKKYIVPRLEKIDPN